MTHLARAEDDSKQEKYHVPRSFVLGKCTEPESLQHFPVLIEQALVKQMLGALERLPLHQAVRL